jgi:putative ABC transport system permease protein
MNVLQSFFVALEMLRLHKLRAFLTMLGVIIGVMSVTMIVMISNGFQSYMTSQFNKAGASTMFVFFDPGRRRQGETTGGIEKMTSADIDYIMERCPMIDMSSGMMSVPSQKVRFNDQSFDNPQIYATDDKFQTLNRFDIIQGRTLTKQDVDSRASVCIIGEDIRDRLFKDRNPIGNLVLFDGIALEVIGIIKKESFLGDSTARQVLVPITTAQQKWVGGDRLDFAMLRARDGVDVNDAMEQVWEALMVRSGNKPMYRVDSNQSILEVFKGVIGAAGVLLAGIAALSLLVGGIGIMNIMLVSVTERTREIGLRKAVGAKRAAILSQFLVESGTLSLVGGLIGMGIAWGFGSLVTLITSFKKWPMDGGLATPFPITAAIMASLFSALIGMVFGLYPAISASKLDPIVALRHE